MTDRTIEKATGHPVTPDRRYFVVRGRLWRMADPSLSPDKKDLLVKKLMAARREVGVAKRAGDRDAERIARASVDRAKHALGERGPVWWADGAPDQNRILARNSTYADWFAELDSDEAAAPSMDGDAR